MEESYLKYMERTKKWLEEWRQGPGFSSQEMEEQWRRNHELSLQRKGMKRKKSSQGDPPESKGKE